MFTGILAAGDAEAKVEVKAFEKLVAEVVPFNHAEVVDRLVSHRELHPELREAGRAESSLHASQPVKGPGSRQTTSERLWKGCSHPHTRPPSPHPSPVTHVAPTCLRRRKAGVNW